MTVTVVVWLAAVVPAAPPTVTAISPCGLPRGKPVDVTITGTNLAAPDARLVLPFPIEQTPLDPKPNATVAQLRVTIPADTPPGYYPVRVAGPDGVSPLTLLAIDDLPSGNEKEPNNTFETAQPLSLPVAVSGQAPGNDLDFYRFTATRGQRLVIETEAARLGSSVLPLLRLTDDRRRFLAGDDTQSVRGDGRIIFTVPADGEYVLELSDTRYRATAPAHYRLKIGEFDTYDEVFPLGGRAGEPTEFTLLGGTLNGERRVTTTPTDPLTRGRFALPIAGLLRPGSGVPVVAVGTLPERIRPLTDDRDPKAMDIRPPVVINGRFDRPGEGHRVQFPVQPGQRWRFDVEADALGSSLDGVLKLSDPSGRLLAQADDQPAPAVPGLQPTVDIDPKLQFEVPAGVTLLVAELRDQRNRGGVNFGYRLSIEPIEADFQVRPNDAEVNVPRGGTALLPVAITRRGTPPFAGPITLTVVNPPKGLTVAGGNVPAGGTAGVLVLTAAADLIGPVTLTIEGRGTGSDGKPLVARGEALAVLTRDPGTVVAPLSIAGVTVGLTSADVFEVRGPAAVEAVQGYPVSLPVTLTRKPPPPPADKPAAAPPPYAVDVTALMPGIPPAPGQPPPPGPYTIKPANIPGDKTAATVELTPQAAAPEGVVDVVLQGRANVANVAQTAISSVIAVSVRRPFTLTPPAGPTRITPGETVTISVKIARQSVFKEPVQLTLTGLPAGVTLATPLMPVPPTATDATLSLKAAPNAPVPAEPVTLTLTATTTIAGAAYPQPPVPIPLTIGKK